MMKNKLANGILTAAALTVFTAFPALAAAPVASAAPNAAAVPITKATYVTQAVRTETTQGSQDGMETLELQTDKNGGRYLVTKDGQKVYITICKGANDAQFAFTPSGK